MLIGAFRSSLRLLLIGGFRSSSFRLEIVPSAVRLDTDRLLCCLIVGIHASGISTCLNFLYPVRLSLFDLASRICSISTTSLLCSLHLWLERSVEVFFLRTFPKVHDLLEPLENAISQVLIPAITERKSNQLDWTILALPVRLGGLGLGNPCLKASREYASSVKVTTPLVEQVVSQSHKLPEDSLVISAQQAVTRERSKEFEDREERIKEMTPRKTKRALDLAERGSSAWLTVLPLRDLGFNLNKRQFRDAVKPRYDWPVDDIPSTCACGEVFKVDHSMICKLGGFVIQRHNELRDLEAELLSMVCSDVDTEPVLQETQDARLDIHRFWEHQRSAIFFFF